MSADENTPENLRYDLDKLREDVERTAEDVQKILKQNEQQHQALTLIAESLNQLRVHLTEQRVIPPYRDQQETLKKFSHATDQIQNALRSKSDS